MRPARTARALLACISLAAAASALRLAPVAMNTRSRTANQVSICTYNVLSSHLAGADHFVSCKPENLKASTRYGRVLEKLKSEMAPDRRSIICLQEVSQTWEGQLHQHFANNNYYFITQLYGNPFNNYMGVGIAVPLEKYSIEECEMVRMSDTKRWPRATSPGPGILARAGGLLSNIVRFPFLSAVFRRKEAPPSCWDLARKRWNVMVSVSLRDKTSASAKDFCVSTYHMPCMFRRPDVMTIHASLAAQHAADFAKGKAFVLAGDFNIKPQDPQYELLTTGTMSVTDAAYPVAPEHEPWRPELSTALSSAYAVAGGEEPAFTNWAKIRDQEPFIETLDYIFLSDHWRVHDVLPLPTRDTSPGPYPTEEEPSDHVMLAARLSH